MTAVLAGPLAQVCTFVLGCAVIHAARAHAEILTRVLVGTAIVAAALVFLAACLTCTPDDPEALDDVSVYAAA